MAKIPYLIRRKNIFYFRLVVPVELRKALKVREIIHSLKTENRAEASLKALELAAHFKLVLLSAKSGKASNLSHQITDKCGIDLNPIISQTFHSRSTSPLLSIVIDDFLNRYDPDNKATLTKLNATLPIFLDLVSDKPVNQLLQADINAYFDEVQKLPVRRDAKVFKGLTIREIIQANTGKCISEGTFNSTYRACVSIFFSWAVIHYKDQGFPVLSVQGAIYRGERADGINKQRAMTSDELKQLFGHTKMKQYAANPNYVHYCWLPLIGLYTGARINEICQLHPGKDILQDQDTGIWYFWFNDESDSAEGVDKSIKTLSSKRVVPIHSQLLALGFLDYVEKTKASGHKIIFPAWQPRNGKASANASKWFKRYLESIGLRDETSGSRLSGFHSFRHTFITYAITHQIAGVFQLTGHEVSEIEGMGKLSQVAQGYWTRGVTDNIQEKHERIEQFDFDIKLIKPVLPLF